MNSDSTNEYEKALAEEVKKLKAKLKNGELIYYCFKSDKKISSFPEDCPFGPLLYTNFLKYEEKLGLVYTYYFNEDNSRSLGKSLYSEELREIIEKCAVVNLHGLHIEQETKAYLEE